MNNRVLLALSMFIARGAIIGPGRKLTVDPRIVGWTQGIPTYGTYTQPRGSQYPTYNPTSVDVDAVWGPADAPYVPATVHPSATTPYQAPSVPAPFPHAPGSAHVDAYGHTVPGSSYMGAGVVTGEDHYQHSAHASAPAEHTRDTGMQVGAIVPGTYINPAKTSPVILVDEDDNVNSDAAIKLFQVAADLTAVPELQTALRTCTQHINSEFVQKYLKAFNTISALIRDNSLSQQADRFATFIVIQQTLYAWKLIPDISVVQTSHLHRQIRSESICSQIVYVTDIS